MGRITRIITISHSFKQYIYRPEKVKDIVCNLIKEDVAILSRTNFTPILDSLFSHASVYAVVIANEEGFPLAYRAKDKGFSGDDAERAAALISSLIGRTKGAMEQMGRGSVNFFTIDVSSGEILVALEKDYVVIAIRERDK